MKNYIITFFCLIFLVNCGGGSSRNNNISYQDKILDWQTREKSINLALQKTVEPTDDLFDDVKYIIQRLPYMQYEPDENDYWQISNDTLNIKQGDCEDLAIFVYMILLDNQNLLDYYNADLYIRWGQYDDGSQHIICVIQSDNGQVVCISNMWVYEGFLDDWRIICDFDLWNIYPGGIQY